MLPLSVELAAGARLSRQAFHRHRRRWEQRWHRPRWPTRLPQMRPATLGCISGTPPPPGWTGKVWAMQQGIAHAEAANYAADYLLLTDADIEYAPSAVTRLVGRAMVSRTVLTSLMVKLNCGSLSERALIPAFVFFFQMLYPFAWVNWRGRKDRCRGRRVHAGRTPRAGKSGRHRQASERADRRLRACETDEAEGPIWLGLSRDVRSLQVLSSYWRYSSHGRPLGLCPARLLAAASCGYHGGMVLTFLAAPVLAILAWLSGECGRGGGLGLDDLGLFADPALLSVYHSCGLAALPLIAAAYLAFTSIQRTSIGGAGVGYGRGAVRPRCEAMTLIAT